MRQPAEGQTGRPKLSDRDPSGLFGSVSTIVAAAVTLLVAFGVPLTSDQQTAVLGFVAVAGPPITALLIRRKAYAPQTHWGNLADQAQVITSPPSDDDLDAPGRAL